MRTELASANLWTETPVVPEAVLISRRNSYIAQTLRIQPAWRSDAKYILLISSHLKKLSI